jgi:hypothetical protein
MIYLMYPDSHPHDRHTRKPATIHTIYPRAEREGMSEVLSPRMPDACTTREDLPRHTSASQHLSYPSGGTSLILGVDQTSELGRVGNAFTVPTSGDHPQDNESTAFGER